MRKILLAENEPFLSGIYAQKLRERGYEIVPAGDGRMALKHIKVGGIDVAVLSADLPEIDGLTLLRKIRNHRDITQASIPVVLLSRTANNEHLEFAMQHGANAYLTKERHSPAEIIKKVLEY